MNSFTFGNDFSQEPYGPSVGYNGGLAAAGFTGGALYTGAELIPPGAVAVAPRPPPLEAQLDAEGNWYYPNPDQQNHVLRIQCEAYRAGAASRSGVLLPMSTPSTPLQSPLGGPRPIRRPQPAAARVLTGRISKATPKQPAKLKSKKIMLAQTCTCREPDNTPKRPPNAFIIYRRNLHAQLRAAVQDNPMLQYDDKGNAITEVAAISALAGKWWAAEKARGGDQHYNNLAQQEKAAHALKYPNYVFQSGRKKELAWGDENCTCGAYQANEAREARRKQHDQEAQIAGSDDLFGDDADAYAEDDDEDQNPLPRSRGPQRRLGGSSIANNGFTPGDFDNGAMFSMESYGADFADTGYGGGIDDSTMLYNSNFDPSAQANDVVGLQGGDAQLYDYSGEAADLPPAYNTRSRSRSRSQSHSGGRTGTLTDEQIEAAIRDQNGGGEGNHMQTFDAPGEE